MAAHHTVAYLLNLLLCAGVKPAEAFQIARELGR